LGGRDKERPIRGRRKGRERGKTLAAAGSPNGFNEGIRGDVDFWHAIIEWTIVDGKKEKRLADLLFELLVSCKGRGRGRR